MHECTGKKRGMSSRILDWFDDRINLRELTKSQLTEYLVPQNLNFWYSMGLVALGFLLIQIITGIFLLMYYIPEPDKAFQSIQFIVEEVPFGWLMHKLHAIGANMMVIGLLLHMVSVIYMGSYKSPRELQWFSGAILFGLTLATCLSGYLLPWSQLSYWAITVATNSLVVTPFIGDELVRFVRGSEGVSGATLGRFFSLHVTLLPLLILGVVGLHLFFMRATGISEPPFVKKTAHKE